MLQAFLNKSINVLRTKGVTKPKHPGFPSYVEKFLPPRNIVLEQPKPLKFMPPDHFVLRQPKPLKLMVPVNIVLRQPKPLKMIVPYRVRLPPVQHYQPVVLNQGVPLTNALINQFNKQFTNLQNGRSKSFEVLVNDNFGIREIFDSIANNLNNSKMIFITPKKSDGSNGTVIVLNDRTVGEIRNLLSFHSLFSVAASGSDAEFVYDAPSYESVKFEVKDRELRTGNGNFKTKSAGGFFPYLNKTVFDLSRYGVFKVIAPENDIQNCLISALRMGGISSDKLLFLYSIIAKNNRETPECKLKDICDLTKIQINLKKLRPDRKEPRVVTYGKSKEVYNIGLLEGHYFINESTIYTSTDIKNYFCTVTPKKSSVKIDSFKLLSLMIKFKSTHLDSVYNHCEMLRNQFYNKGELNLSNLYYDEDVCTKPASDLKVEEVEEVEEDEEKKKKDSPFDAKLFFDFESITEYKHIEYQCGFVDENENYQMINGIDVGFRFLKLLVGKGYENVLLIAHNAGYDFSFLVRHFSRIQPIIRNGTFYGAKCLFVYKGKRLYVTIKDSYKLISDKLSNFGRLFKLSIKKDIIPYKLYTVENVKKIYVPIKEGVAVLEKAGKTKKQIQTFLDNIKEWKCDFTGNMFNIFTYSAEYNKLDCLVLKRGYEIFRGWMKDLSGGVLDIDNIVSNASYGHKFMQLKGVYDDVNCISGVPQMFIQKTVTGGRNMSRKNAKYHLQTDLTKDDTKPINNRYKKKHISISFISDFDCTSLYPSAMYEMPGYLRGNPKVITNLSKEFLNTVDGYFVNVKIIKLLKKRKFPLTNILSCGIQNFTNDIVGKEFYLNKFQLEDLVEHQLVDYEVISGYYFDEGRNTKIKETIKTIFDKRAEMRKLKNPIQEAYKLIMNSCYGKTLLKASEIETVFIKKSEWDTYLEVNYNFIKSFEFIGSEEKSRLVMVERYISLDNHFNIPHVGSEILAYSKRIMNRVMCLAEDNGIKIYYQDTDSMHIPRDSLTKLYVLYKDKYGVDLEGKYMGQFHTDFKIHKYNEETEEYEEVDGLDIFAIESIILGKKSYIDVLLGVNHKNLKKAIEDGKLTEGMSYLDILKVKDVTDVVYLDYHIRMKGIPSSSITYYCSTHNITPLELFKLLLNGAEVKFDLTCGGMISRFEKHKDFSYSTKQIDPTRTVKF